MSARHWRWIAYGLVGWAVLTVLWMTTPSVCSLPAAAGSSHCAYEQGP
jgi:hypothetical protein